jgi:hypothetical protein
LGIGSEVFALDTSDPAIPRVLSRIATNAWAREIRVVGTQLHVSAGHAGLIIADVANPAAPRILSRIPDPAIESDASGNLLAVVDGGSGLRFYDTANPEAPVLLGAVSLDGPISVDLEGDRAYVATAGGFARVFNIRDPAHPWEIITFGGNWDSGSQIAAKGRFTFYFSDDPVFDIVEEYEAGRYRYTPGPFLRGSNDVRIEGDFLYSTWGLTADILDITDPLAITRRDPTMALRSLGEGIAASPGRLYVAERDHGVSIFDTSMPGAPVRVGEFGRTSRPIAAFAAGDLVYTADYDRGVSVIDVSDAASPVIVSQLSTRNSAVDLRAVGDLLYVADDQAGLTIIDVSDPAFPRLRGSHPVSRQAWDVEVVGHFAYVSELLGRLFAFDVQDPDVPVLVSTLTVEAHKLCTGAGRLFAIGPQTLSVMDLDDPSHPAIVAQTRVLPFDSAVTDVAYQAGRLYMSAADVGLVVYDVSDPSQPRMLGRTDLPGDFEDVAVRGNRAFIAKNLEGVDVFDISDPFAPTLLGNITTGGQARGVHASQQFLLISTLQGGLVTATFGGPSILSQPRDATTCLGGAVALSVQLEDPRDAAYQWLHEGAPIEGATNPEYTFLADSPADAGSYSVLITTPCGSLESHKALVTICLADFTCDGQVDFFDYLEFVDAFEAESPAADRDGNSQVDFFDYLDFVMAFSGDC